MAALRDGVALSRASGRQFRIDEALVQDGGSAHIRARVAAQPSRPPGAPRSSPTGPRRLRMLDLFAGTGSASAAMVRRGWDVTRVDIRARAGDHYPSVDIVADITRLPVRPDTAWDLVWASPPCTEYSRSIMPWFRNEPPPDQTLWRAAMEAIRVLMPRWWVIENVRGAVRTWGPSTRSYGPIFLWGHFPSFQCKVRPFKEHLDSARRVERAATPIQLSEALAEACEREAALLPMEDR